jgi:hypothetical protein
MFHHELGTMSVGHLFAESVVNYIDRATLGIINYMIT